MNPQQDPVDIIPFRDPTSDAPRTGPAAGRPILGFGLWAGMAGTVLAAAVTIGTLSLSAPPAALPGESGKSAGSTTAAGAVVPAGPALADDTARPVRLPLPLDAFADPAATPEAGSRSGMRAGLGAASGTGTRDPAKSTAAGPARAKVPAVVVRPPAPTAAPAPAPAPAPAAAPAPAPAPAMPAPAPVAPAVRTIYVAGSGGQEMIDACIGPIHFTPNDGYSLFITEHDFCGGWARFSGIAVGETVSLPGYGTYAVTGRGQVPNPGTTNDVVAVFGGFPRAILQTCIPGTSQMLLIALN